MSLRRFLYRMIGYAFDPWTGVPLVPSRSVGGQSWVTIQLSEVIALTSMVLEAKMQVVILERELRSYREAALLDTENFMEPRRRASDLN
jgi:hypothetical protein